MKKSDPAHIATDEEIAKIEKLITKEYKKAHKEVSKKCEDYFAKFAAKDAKWQEWVAQGTKTQKEYKEWRQGQMLVGKKWEDLRDTLAQDYTNAAQITMSITKGFAPEVYAINHNYATFEVEKKSLIDTSYTLYSKEAVEHMYKGKPKLYHTYGKAVAKEIKEGKQYAWDRRRITSVLTQAILQGESIPNITKRLEAVTAGDHKAAIRNARTMMTGVQNAGRIDAMERAVDKGIPVQKQWLATLDMRTRHWHRELDGAIVDVDEPFENEIGKIMFPGDPDADAANVYSCRCTLLPAIKGFALDVTDPSVRPNDKLGDMTYDEWKASKTSISNPITAQEDKGKAIAGAWNAKYGKGGTIENPTHKHTAAEGKALMDKYANETLAETPISTKTIRNYENPVAKAVGRERYDEIIDALDEAKETDVKKLFQQHIDEVKVISHNSKGGAYCSVQSISWNAEKGRVDTRLKKAFSTFYHESGHAIDNMLAKEKGGIWHFSTSWNGGEFSKTIKEEVSSWVEGIKNDLKAGLKAHATDVKWLQEKGLLSEYGLQHLEYLANKNGCTVEDILSKKFKVPDAKRFMPKVVNQNAYNVITKEIREIQQTEHGEWKIADISDILEGATKGNLQCGWGHGKSYWKDTDVAVEAFAEMMQAHTVNEESLKVLEKYLPKSVGAFRRMCADAVR